jgi:thiosulfate dehydrogenase
LLVMGAAFGYFLSGSAPVATAYKMMPFERMLASGALHARIEKEMPKSVPISADESTFLAGAKVYRDRCGLCHGLPNMDQGPIAKGMFPKPPHLFRGKGVADDEPGETYWKLANGIRLTGMPSFKNSLSETEMWQVSVLLANADKIWDAVKQELEPPNFPGTPPGGSGRPGMPASEAALTRLRLPCCRHRMQCLVPNDLRLVLKREIDIVESLQ